MANITHFFEEIFKKVLFFFLKLQEDKLSLRSSYGHDMKGEGLKNSVHKQNSLKFDYKFV